MPAANIDLESVITRDFGSIPEVVGTSIHYEDGDVVVYIQMDKPPKAIRYMVYDKQMSLMETFPGINFDFNIVQAR